MPTPKLTERVAILETKHDAFSKEVFKRFDKLDVSIAEVSLNGQVPRVKALAVRLGDPEDVDILAAVVEDRKRRAWLFGPLTGVRRGVFNAAIWTGTGLTLAALHAWWHASFPSVP